MKIFFKKTEVSKLVKPHYYEFVVDGKVRYKGITSTPVRREQEHQTRWPNGYIVLKGACLGDNKEEVKNWFYKNGENNETIIKSNL